MSLGLRPPCPALLCWGSWGQVFPSQDSPGRACLGRMPARGRPGSDRPGRLRALGPAPCCPCCAARPRTHVECRPGRASWGPDGAEMDRPATRVQPVSPSGLARRFIFAVFVILRKRPASHPHRCLASRPRWPRRATPASGLGRRGCVSSLYLPAFTGCCRWAHRTRMCLSR